MSQVAIALPGEVGFYGKIPAEPDFVRVNAGAFLRAGLDRWFEEGVEHLQRARLPAEPTCFLLALAADAPPFVGVFAPGEDALGRAFPVVVFAELDQSPLVDLSLLPLRLASFCAAGARLAMTAHALATDQVAAEIGSLVSKIRPAVPALDALLVGSSCADLCAALGGSCEAAAYALTTIVAACAQARQADSPARVLVLDCPAATDELRTFWLELVRRHRVAQMPSFFWTRESGRLLVALGPAPSLMLAYLADPDHKGSRRWPLCTHVACGNAVDKLSLAQRQVLAAGDASLADVLHVF
jgi:type VI secretion system protein ImpM